MFILETTLIGTVFYWGTSAIGLPTLEADAHEFTINFDDTTMTLDVIGVGFIARAPNDVLAFDAAPYSWNYTKVVP